MSLNFYDDNEDTAKEESINNYIDLFYNYEINPPNIKEALNQMFASSGASEIIIEELIEDIISKSEKTIKRNLKKIKEKYPEITEDDSLTISSYTCESKDSNFSPYRLLNTSLVSKNRKNGLEKISKYLYILLNALRKLKRYYPEPDNNYLY